MKNHWQEGYSPADAALQPGAHLVTPRCGYSHHGIYVGAGKVVHYAGLCCARHAGPVEETSIDRFAAGRAIWLETTPRPRYDGNEIVRRR